MRARRRGRAGRFLRRVAFLLIAVVAASIVWLDRKGLPAPARERLRAAIRRAGLDADFTGLRLALPDGVEASGVRLFQGPASRRPRVEAAVVRIRLRWMDLLRRKPCLEGLEVRDGSLLLGTDLEPAAGETIREIQASLLLEETTLSVGSMSGVWRGITIRAAGRVILARGPDGRLQPPNLLPHGLLPGGGGAPFDPERLPLAFPGGGRIEAGFDLDAAAPERATLTLQGEGGALTWNGLPMEGWSLSARLSGGRIQLEDASLRAGGERLSITASLSPADRTAEVRIHGSVPATHAALIPLPARADRIRTGIDLQSIDPLRFDVTLGPAAVTSLVDRIRGRVNVSRTELMGVWLENLALVFEREGPALRIVSADGIAGRGAAAGPFHMEGGIDLPSGDYRGNARTAFDPHAMMPWLDPAQSLHVGATLFRSVPPVCTAEVTGRMGDIRRLVLNGAVTATNFVYNGALLAAASARIQVSNQVMRLDDIRAERAEGAIVGWIEQDFIRRMLRFDIDSSIHPAAAGRLCGPSPHRFVSHFRTEGPARIRARGHADYGERRENDATFEIEAQDAGMGWLLLNRCAFQGRIRGRHVEITNVTGTVYGGTFAGHAALDLADGGETRTRYHAIGNFAVFDLPSVLRALTDREEQTHEGRLSGAVDLTGFIGAGQGHTAVGSGSIRIEDGRLLEIPLFGGFSRHLGRIIPGVAFASQSDFFADFRVANGRAATEQAELQGDILTMRARGSYGFDRSLDFVVEAKLLREGLVADVVRLLTLPVTKLLEFDLGGSLIAPQWTPRNMPKELMPAPEKGGNGERK